MAIFAAKLPKLTSDWRLCPQFPSVIRLSCISLFSTGPKLDNFCAKKFHFGLIHLPLSQILVALLVAFTAADRLFKQLYGPDTKRVETLPVLYDFFSDINAKLLKFRIICSREISVFMCKSSVYCSAPPPLAASAPLLPLLWQRHWPRGHP